MQSKSSTPRAMVVARATPMIPIRGAPSSPKIKTAFKRMFRSRAEALVKVANTTRSIERIVHKYTWEMLIKR